MQIIKHSYVVCGIFGLILLFSAGCTTPMQPAAVNANTICNPTVGWNGYQLQIPEGLERVDCLSVETTEEQIAIHWLQNLWNKRNRKNSGCGEQFGEIFFFKDPDRKTYISLSAQVVFFAYPMPAFSFLLPSEKQRVYDFVAHGITHKPEHVRSATVGEHQAFYVFEPETEGIPQMDTAGPKAFAFCAFLGDTRDVYVIAGYSAAKDAALLKQNMQKMMDGFSFL